MEDSNGLNILHCLVVNNDAALLEWFIMSDSNFAQEMVTGCTRITTEKEIVYNFQWKDLKGRTARDYAVMFMRDAFVVLLDNLELQ
eukprot:gene33792-41686_t